MQQCIDRSGRRIAEREFGLINQPVIVFLIAFTSIATLGSQSTYGAENDNLEVNMNLIYMSSKKPKDMNVLSETVIQYPLPLSSNAELTGKGFFGGITFYENFIFYNSSNQNVTQDELGRIYYFANETGEGSNSIVPFVTIYRGLTYSYNNISGNKAEVQEGAFFLPGILASYKLDEKSALHSDIELYNLNKIGHARTRTGYAYQLTETFIISLSHETNKWGGSSTNALVDGSSVENNLKLILRNTLPINFAFTAGWGRQFYNSHGPGVLYPNNVNSDGLYVGFEGSAGFVTW